MEIKTTHESGEQWKIISFQKRGRLAKLQDVTLQPLYNSQRAIQKAKADDVKSLLPFIPPVRHGFYIDIVVDRLTKGTADSVEVTDEDCCHLLCR